MAEIVVFGIAVADIILRVQRIPAPGDHVNAGALGWRIGGSSANVACGLSPAGHHARLAGPAGRDGMGERTIIAADSGAEPSSFLPVRQQARRP